MLGRRTFLAGAAGLALVPWLPRRARAALSEDARKALAKSGFVYVSPLRSDGSESTCHAEVWFAWLDGKVVLITAADRWKARSVAGGSVRTRSSPSGTPLSALMSSTSPLIVGFLRKKMDEPFQILQ